SPAHIYGTASRLLMSDPRVPRERPRLRGTLGQCNHPKLLALTRSRHTNETVYRCMLCGRITSINRLREEQRRLV
ncbi:MAG: hypothetical protein WCC94_06935, partial [Candidatus Bathyarchaeia archaeon]